MNSVSGSKNLRNKNLQGQNVIEYLLVTAVFVLVCIAFFKPSGGPARTALENIFNDAVLDIAELNKEIILNGAVGN